MSPKLFRFSLWSRIPGLLPVLGLTSTGLAGCVGDPAPTVDASGASTPTNTPSVSPTPTPAASSPLTSASVRVLPESVLSPIPGLRYSRIEGALEIPDEVAARPEVHEGMVGRSISRKGYRAGTVQLIRLRPGVLTSAAGRRDR